MQVSWRCRGTWWSYMSVSLSAYLFILPAGRLVCRFVSLCVYVFVVLSLTLVCLLDWSVCLSVCLPKYGQQQSIAVSDTTCIPLVFEHFGFWGPRAEDYLNKISKISKDANGKCSEIDFRDRWRKQLSVVVQSCNSRVILKSCRSCLSAILIISV